MQIIDFNTNGYSFKPGGGGSSAKLGTTNLYPDTVSNVYMAEDEGLDGWSSVIVEGVDASIDGNILPENIKKGVKILRVEGTLEEGDYDEIYDEIVNLNAGDVEGTYSYYDGFVDVEGLKEIGWTDTDIKYFRDNAPHYFWDDYKYAVSEENKAIHIADFRDIFNWQGNKDIKFIPVPEDTRIHPVWGPNAYFGNFPNALGIPLVDTSTQENFNGFCQLNYSLITIPPYDTSSGTDFMTMFSNCNNLRTIPPIDTSNGTRFTSMFYMCASLKTIPYLETRNGTDFSGMFQQCTTLESIPNINTLNGTNFRAMFSDCVWLKEVPILDTSNGTDFTNMFSGCGRLEKIRGLNLTNCTSNLTSTWMPGSFNLTYIRLSGSINVSVSFSNLRNLDFDSYKSILEAASRTTTPAPKTLTFYNRTIEDHNGELAALVSDCANRGWTITGLTLN